MIANDDLLCAPGNATEVILFRLPCKRRLEARRAPMQRPVRRSTAPAIPAAIEQSRLLDGVPHDVAADIVAQAFPRNVEAGTVMFLQDQDAAAAYVIDSGWVKLFRETLNGDEAIFDVLTTGHLLGCFDGSPSGRHRDSAAALTDVKLYVMSSALLAGHIRGCPELALNIIRIKGAMSFHHSMDLEHERLQSAPQRLGCFLLRFCEGKPIDRPVHFNMPIDKGVIATRLGMKAETLSRALASLKQEVGLVVQGSAITIPQPQRLADLACGACSASERCVD